MRIVIRPFIHWRPRIWLTSLMVFVALLTLSGSLLAFPAPASGAEAPPPFLRKWGSWGSGDGQFKNPYGVAVDASGNVYVVDTGNPRIQKFSSSGAFLAKWGSSGSGDGQFEIPYGVAVDAWGKVYVVDTGNPRIQKFSNSGAFLAKWGSWGNGDGQFNYPSGVAVNASGNVYVADTSNSRIQVFGVPAVAPSADFVGVGAVSGAQTVAAGETVNFTDTSINSPTSWAWDFNNDGTTDSTLQNPTNVYTVAGTYSVKLTATNAGGSGDTTKTNYITVTPGALHHITVSPSHPTVDITASQTFTATGFDQFNNARSGDTIAWSVANATVGSINASTGVFTAGTVAGTYNNVVVAVSGAVTGNASVVVTPGPLHHIMVGPSHPTVGITASQTFTATGFDQFNNARTGDTFTWSVAGASAAAGTINATTGVFTATSNPANIADYADAIVATSGAVTGSTSVTISSPLARLPGDVDDDGDVDLLDLAAVAAAFHSSPGSPNWNAAANFDLNETINVLDLVVVGLNFGASLPD